MTGGNTAQKPRRGPGKPFTGRGDPRNNLKGRPRAFDDLRQKAIGIMNELVTSDADKKKKELRVTRILRRMAESKNHCIAALEIAYGKVPNPKSDEVTSQNLIIELELPPERTLE